ncbi:antibiotic biosynthesis monooxygenase family protein [Salinicoccus sp. CNSTN-B1]
MILTDVENNYQVSIEEEKAIIRSNSEEKGYSIIESKGSLETKGFCVLNNVYINTGMEKAFEARFLNRQSNLATVTGFKALRVMKAESWPLLRHSDIVG